MMDWSAIAKLMAEQPELFAGIAGVAVAFLVQGYKKLFGTPPNEEKTQKVMVTVALAIIAAFGQQWANSQFNVGELVAVAFATWAVAAGVHGTALRSG